MKNKDKDIIEIKNGISQILEKISLNRKSPNGAPLKKCSGIGRFFQWLDDNILSKTARLWMYMLEIAGVIVIFVVLGEFQHGLRMLVSAQSDFDIKKAQIIISSVKEFATPVAVMVSTICGAIPTIMGVFRSLKKKWGVESESGKDSSAPSNNEQPPPEAMVGA